MTDSIPVPLPDGSSASALWQSFFMIIASEIGDKTFLIAAILSMRHPRMVVFLGAFSSLVVMSILSAGMGQILPQLVPRKWTQLAASLLFLVFGAKMAWEGWEMESGQGKIQEELREVEEEIELGDGHNDRLQSLEEGGPLDEDTIELEIGTTPSKPAFKERIRRHAQVNKVKEGARNFASLFFGPVFVQSFVLTFLGEWGDRSQIATIALAAAHNVYIVTLGTVIGHSICTGVAVLGGRWLSTQISIKHVTLGGAVLFVLFGIIYLHEGLKSD